MRPLKFQPLDYAAAYGFTIYAATATVTPICLLHLASELNFQLSGGGGIEAVRAIPVVLILLMSGFLGARWGKGRVLSWGAYVLAAGMLAYAFSPTYGAVLLAMILVGAGSGILDGLINPMVHELHPQDSGKYLNTINGFWSVGVLLAVLTSGDLLTRGVSWRWIMGSAGLLCLVAGLLFHLFSRKQPRQVTHTQGEAVGHLRDVAKHPHFALFFVAMFLAGGVEGGFTFWTASYIQLQYEALPRAAGIGTAFFAGGMITGRFVFGHTVHQRGLWALLMLSSIGGGVLTFMLPLAQTLGALYVLLFAVGLAIACLWPSIQSYAAERMDVDPTMLMILLSCGGLPGFGLTCWLMGVVGDQYGLRVSFLILPAAFFPLALLLVRERYRKN